MGLELFQLRPEAQAVFNSVFAATGVDVQDLCFNADEETLRQTQNAQLALFTTSVAAFRCLKRHLGTEVRIEAVAGHSVGEFAACVAAGLLDLAEGASLVAERGRLMAEAGQETPGTMAAILGLDRPDLEKALAKVTEGIVVIANDNCPGQIVISGEVAAVEAAGEKAKAAGAKRVIPLNVSGAFHSPLMQSAGDQFGDAIARARWSSRTDVGPIYSNVTSEAVGRESELPSLLQSALTSPVRWTETVEHLLRDGFDTFIECGSGDVLSSLIRRIDKSAKTLRVQDLDSLESTVAEVRP